MTARVFAWVSRLPSRWPGRRAHLPLRVAPMLLVGMVLLVLGVLSTVAF